MIRFIYQGLRRVGIIRWCIVILLLVAVSLETANYVVFSRGFNASYQTLIFTQLSNTPILCFTLTYPFILLCMDITGEQGSLSNRTAQSLFGFCLVNATFYMLFFILVNVVVGNIVFPSDAQVMSTYIIGDKLIKELPMWSASIISMLLLFLRFLAMALIMSAVNLKSKMKIGFLIPITISIVDTQLPGLLFSTGPLYFLPIEHTVPSILSNYSDGHYRVEYYISFAIWMLVIVIMYNIIEKTNERGILNEANE